MIEKWNSQNVAGRFNQTPKGVILHGSRSGILHSIDDEFNSLSNYGEVTKLAFNASIGEDKIAFHINPSGWGWNARGCSSLYLAIEFAQPTIDYPIPDSMVRAFCIWFRDFARVEWPNLPKFFPTHSLLDGSVEYGPYDGKTDVFPEGDPRTLDLRNRIAAHMEFFGIS